MSDRRVRFGVNLNNREPLLAPHYTFICRFGSLDQVGQVERFAREVLPRFT